MINIEILILTLTLCLIGILGLRYARKESCGFFKKKRKEKERGRMKNIMIAFRCPKVLDDELKRIANETQRTKSDLLLDMLCTCLGFEYIPEQYVKPGSKNKRRVKG